MTPFDQEETPAGQPVSSPEPAARRLGRRELIGLGVGAGLGAGAGLGGVVLASGAAAQSAAQSAARPAQQRAPAPAPPAGGPPGLPLATEIRSELKAVAPNIYAFLQREAPGMSNLSISNCGVVVGPKGLLAIDSTAAPVQAKKFRAAAERATGKRFTRMVITHHHVDHILGIQFFDGVEVIAQDQCRALMEKQSLARPAFWDRNNRAWSDGTEEFQLVLPSTTYSERMTLRDYGSTVVQFMFPGRAHTLGDTNVYMPNEKVIFIGDIGFFDVTPLNGSGFIANWIKVCDDILRMDVTTIVPGHGPVGGKAELEEMKGYLVLIYNEGKKRYDRGVGAGRAAAEIDLGKYAKWVDSDRIVTNMARLYTEFAGTIGEGVDQDSVRKARQEYNMVKGIAS